MVPKVQQDDELIVNTDNNSNTGNNSSTTTDKTNNNPTRFVIQYCHGCDGGTQEFFTVALAVRRVFPNAQILGHRRSQYPIQVTVTAFYMNDKNNNKDQTINDGIVVWHGEQRNFFQKYHRLRLTTVARLRNKLTELKEHGGPSSKTTTTY